jgi:hypothetical protein
MIICQKCSHREFVGTLFCSNCGTQMVHPTDNRWGTALHETKSGTGKKQEAIEPYYSRNPSHPFMLYMIQEDQFIALEEDKDYTLGRLSPDQVLTPDIDLTGYNAYDRGVSRLHATILLDQKNAKAQIIDLGSANGTQLNGVPIPANSEVPLYHNDVLTLGKLKIQVILGVRILEKDE